MVKKVIMLCTLLLLISFSLTFAENSLSVNSAWIPEAPRGMKVMAAYMIVNNNSGNDYELVGVSSDRFEKVEMHRTIIENDQARMEKQESMPINAGSQLEFKPGGSHLMLFNPKDNLKSGDKVDLNLMINDGNSLTVKAVVRKYSEMQGMKHGH